MRQASRTMALCGILTALGVVILSLGALIPAATFCCPVLASFLLTAVLTRCGAKAALTAYAATAILALLLSPDAEISFLYAALGYYPVLKPRAERLGKPAATAVKLVWFNASAALAYGLLLWVFRIPSLRQEFQETGRLLMAALAVLGNITFFLYDAVLGKLTRRYLQKFGK